MGNEIVGYIFVFIMLNDVDVEFSALLVRVILTLIKPGAGDLPIDGGVSAKRSE